MNPVSAITNGSIGSSGLTSSAPLRPDYSSTLDLAHPNALVKNLEQIIETLESYRTEENNAAYMSRQIAREKAKMEVYAGKRRDENLLRVSQGMPPLPDEDLTRLFKVPAEPSRLESVLLLGQLDSNAKNVEDITSAGLVKNFAASPRS